MSETCLHYIFKSYLGLAKRTVASATMVASLVGCGPLFSGERPQSATVAATSGASLDAFYEVYHQLAVNSQSSGLANAMAVFSTQSVADFYHRIAASAVENSTNSLEAWSFAQVPELLQQSAGAVDELAAHYPTMGDLLGADASRAALNLNAADFAAQIRVLQTFGDKAKAQGDHSLGLLGLGGWKCISSISGTAASIGSISAFGSMCMLSTALLPKWVNIAACPLVGVAVAGMGLGGWGMGETCDFSDATPAASSTDKPGS